jgi:hypothetical protein
MPISSIGALYDASNVKVGSAVGFVSPVGTDDPDDSVLVFDPAIWVTPWLHAGATEQGWQVNWTPQTQDINIDEQPTPVDRQITTAALEFVANLAEDTLQSWGWALNADKTVVAPATGVFGKSVLTPSGVAKRMKVVLETQNVLDMPRRYIVPEMVCIANVGATFRRAASQRLIPVTFSSVCNLTDIRIDDITAPAT